MKQLPARKARAVELYSASPALADWDPTEAVSKETFCNSIIVMLGLAGLQGTLGAVTTLLTSDGGHVHSKSLLPADFPIPFGDRDALRSFILETLRLRPPVFGACAVAPVPIRVDVAGKP